MEKTNPNDMNGQTKIINTLSEKAIGGCFVQPVIEDMTEKSLVGRLGIKGKRDYKNITTFLGLRVVVGTKGFAPNKILFVSAEKCSTHPRGLHDSVQSLVRCLATNGRIYLLENKLL